MMTLLETSPEISLAASIFRVVAVKRIALERHARAAIAVQPILIVGIAFARDS